MFYRLFLSDACLGKACYEKCKYKYDKSAADIRIGDLWGKTYERDDKGVSGVVIFSEKGKEILKCCNANLIEHPFALVAEGQMKMQPKQKFFFKKVRQMMLSEKELPEIYSVFIHLLHIDLNLSRIKHPFRTLKKIFIKIK